MLENIPGNDASMHYTFCKQCTSVYLHGYCMHTAVRALIHVTGMYMPHACVFEGCALMCPSLLFHSNNR